MNQRGAAIEEQHRGARAVRELPILVVVALLVAFLLKTFVAQAFYIPSGSMEPQLHVGDRVVVSKLAYRLHDPRRGDIVVFPAPDQPPPSSDDFLPVRWAKDLLQGVGLAQPDETELIKRIIGLPGETVEGHDGHVFINGRELIEPYLPKGTRTSDFAPVSLTSGKVWMMGDNRPGSADSRKFGPVDESTIVGRAIFKAWPPWDASFL
ncbi:MAG: signal peptidase [Acidimicrobiaceae bacterium]